MQHEVEIIPLDWNPELEMGTKWRTIGANLREATPQGQTRSVELGLNMNTGWIIAKIGRRNVMGKISRPKYFAISIQQITQIFLDYDQAVMSSILKRVA